MFLTISGEFNNLAVMVLYGKRRVIVLLGGFFLLVPLALGMALFSLSRLQASSSRSGLVLSSTSFGEGKAETLRLYTALPSQNGQLSFGLQTGDARPVIIKQYLRKYNSPLAPYADELFIASQKYNLDYRLLVAIAQQESNLGKKIPPETYNAWGWGIHSQGTLGFSGWPEAIEAVAKGLREEYLDKGYRTPEEIMTKYTPLSEGSWAFGVNQFMAEME